MEEKQLFWIKGDPLDPAGVRGALYNRGIHTDELASASPEVFRERYKAIYGVPGYEADVTDDWSRIFTNLIRPLGERLEPDQGRIREDWVDRLKPFTPVIVRTTLCDNAPWFADIFLGSFDSTERGETHRRVAVSRFRDSIFDREGTSSPSCDGIEMHPYEEWMAQYIGKTTPFSEWKKETGEQSSDLFNRLVRQSCMDGMVRMRDLNYVKDCERQTMKLLRKLRKKKEK